MSRFIMKRLLSAFITVIIVFTINFIIITAAPGSPVRSMMGKETSNIELQKALEEKYGLNEPLHKQFLVYLKNAANLY